MTKNALKNILLMLIPVSLCCCSAEKEKKSVQEVSSQPDYETTVLAFDTTGHLYDNSKNPQFEFSYKLTVPNEGISSCADSIRLAMIAAATGIRTNDIAAAQSAKIASIMDLSEEDVEAYRESFSAQETAIEYICEADKVYEDSDLYNSVFNSYTYTGGAHAFACSDYLIWDKANSKRVNVDDVFVDGYESEVTKMILDYLCRTNGVKNHADLVEVGILDVKDVAPNGSLRIYPDSLSFNYKPYEIAAYAVGSIEVKISFKDLKPLMKTNSPLYKFAE